MEVDKLQQVQECENKKSYEVQFKTRVPAYTFNVQWNIENISEFGSNIEMRSPFFELIPGQDWYIEFKTNSSNCQFIYLYSKSEPELKIEAETSLMDVVGELLYSESRQPCSYKDSKVILDLVPNLTTEKWQELRILSSDVIVFKCCLKLTLPVQTTMKMHTAKLEDRSIAVDIAINDLKKLYDDETHADVILQAKGVQIKAHKAILVARSPTFANMFQHNLQESRDNVIRIKDIQPNIMKKFVSLLYYPVLEHDLDIDTALDLYYAANKYEVLTIRDAISRFLLSQLNLSNCLRLLVFSYQHEDVLLRTEVMKYIDFHIRFIVETEMWEQFVINQGKLASTIIANYFKDIKF